MLLGVFPGSTPPASWEEGREVHQGDTGLCTVKTEEEAWSSVMAQAWIPGPEPAPCTHGEPCYHFQGVASSGEPTGFVQEKNIHVLDGGQMLGLSVMRSSNLGWSHSFWSIWSSSQPTARCSNRSLRWVGWVCCPSCERGLVALQTHPPNRGCQGPKRPVTYMNLHQARPSISNVRYNTEIREELPPSSFNHQYPFI